MLKHTASPRLGSIGLLGCISILGQLSAVTPSLPLPLDGGGNSPPPNRAEARYWAGEGGGGG